MCFTEKSCGVFVFLAVLSFFTSTNLYQSNDVEKGRQLMAALLSGTVVKVDSSQLQVYIFRGNPLVLMIMMVIEARLANLGFKREREHICCA